jgi:AraC-like DNA-binding protein
VCSKKFLPFSYLSTMKALSFRIPKTEQTSFRVQVDDEPYFYDRLHYHPEWQITVILRGTGTLFVGDGINRFQAGDVFAVGSNVPHLLRSDALYYQPASPGVYAISLFFEQNSFGKGFFDIPEMQHIADFLRTTSRGVRVLGNAVAELQELMINIVAENSFQRLQSLLEILNTFAEAPEFEYLSNSSFTEAQKETDGARLNDVLEFTLTHYQRPIQLEEAAQVASLSVPAFCRYFKLRTRKSYIQFLNELRVSAACKLLAEREANISEICYEVGFNNLSNFNRQFKRVTGFTPSAYLRRFQQ